MSKLDLVEESFRNGNEIVFTYGDTIWICFGGTELYNNERLILFKDCCKADITEDQQEYWGDIENGSYDLYFKLENYDFNEWFIPTKFYKKELQKIIKKN